MRNDLDMRDFVAIGSGAGVASCTALSGTVDPGFLDELVTGAEAELGERGRALVAHASSTDEAAKFLQLAAHAEAGSRGSAALR